jgi:hypothetical protein
MTEVYSVFRGGKKWMEAGFLRREDRLAEEILRVKRKPAMAAGFSVQQAQQAYLILASLYITCLRMVGSNFFISILPGWLRLFLVVV